MSRHSICSALLALACVAPAFATSGTVVSGSTVYALDRLGGPAPAIRPVLELDRAVQGAVRDGDSWLGLVADDLVRFAAASGAELGSTALTVPADVSAILTLELAPDGTLWALGTGTFGQGPLYYLLSIDRSSGVVTEVAGLERALSGLTIEDGQLLSMTNDGSSQGSLELVRIDPVTGALEVLGTLENARCPNLGDLDFDDGGILYAFVDDACSPDPSEPGLFLASYRVPLGAPPSAEPFTELSFQALGDNVPLAAAYFEVVGTSSVVAVPTLGAAGLEILCLLLAAGGGLLLRRGRAVR